MNKLNKTTHRYSFISYADIGMILLFSYLIYINYNNNIKNKQNKSYYNDNKIVKTQQKIYLPSIKENNIKYCKINLNILEYNKRYVNLELDSLSKKDFNCLSIMKNINKEDINSIEIENIFNRISYNNIKNKKRIIIYVNGKSNFKFKDVFYWYNIIKEIRLKNNLDIISAQILYMIK